MEKTDEGLGGMDCMRDVVFHKLFAPIFELIHENISCEQKRSKALKHTAQQVLDSLDEAASGGNDKMLAASLPGIRRLAFKSPFSEISEVMRNYLKTSANATWLKDIDNECCNRPSYFVPLSDTVPVSPKEVEVRQMFEDIFASKGRLSHLDQLLGWHPSFLQAFTITTEFLMHGEGALSLPIRNYLAILASSLHDCEYLVSLQQSEFVFNRGDPTWLEGIHRAPDRVKGIMTLARRLAHEPWKISSKDIAEQIEVYKWTLAELVQTIAILCTFFSLSGLTFGVGVLPEVDFEAPSRPCRETRDYKLTVETFAQAQKNSEELHKMLDTTNRKGKRKGKKGVATDGETGIQKASAVEDIACLDNLSDRSRYPQYTGKQIQRYCDFNIKTEKLHRRQDYNWRSHGYSLMMRFYQGFSPLLNEEFEIIYNLTYKRLTTAENVDTRPFRRAVWYYVLRLYGMENDDYNYANINKLLNKQIKRYIKKCACSPQDIQRRDYEVFGYAMTADEKCHVALLVFEARRQASLVYGLKALGEYMNSK
mmetsp:Transcript_25901/g.45999  ORF Transcript_25901/g.45999 Transcript_25901/m.45999 type:complete len:537 (-) Transcript_25901:214-1824(-)|eukprot:CAMPEP_0197534960 /NCGR_PEP_ID=MMETSP1318-20131121/48919_1 /TAXON_ID=552666 /ORGANISM="Partenskyella glossopodia, Strain RCC365" /LENGTH=536 /DNA_ID=CAMNT_0043092407 /DNA_START=66 /DNA_END=1676 /DNA_ORIENTATION=+